MLRPSKVDRPDVDLLTMYLADSPGAFLSSFPEWSLADGTLTCPDGNEGRIDQRPFHWADGVWEAEVRIFRGDEHEPPHRAPVRIAPETLRRWKEVGIDPLVEACAQLRDHL